MSSLKTNRITNLRNSAFIVLRDILLAFLSLSLLSYTLSCWGVFFFPLQNNNGRWKRMAELNVVFLFFLFKCSK